ncbi:poly-gamma-glutamate synthesis protein (capsule biosynthesis protein) [Nocardioides sp. BE266]|uniref:CapA family protein n=1 Tax=Nocardioides sp. BE266 TaxID=2817725 RepID=UPI002865771B|nr:CapA family protein [Nocardioides sp. BE266]MDR7254530.1 poly-gamma-glutamate synthesis protein (capsule biosynthesis protein) [Nocardioides sp. BE266]
MAGAGVRGVRRTRAAAALVGVVALTGCTNDPAGTAAPSRPTTSSTPAPPPTRSPTPTNDAPDPPIRIALAGDIHFEGPLAARLRDPATALAPVSDALSTADLTIVNLETSVGTGGRPEPGKRFTFSAAPEAFDALAAAGVDVATMANNHALDYGRARLPSTFAAIRSAARADSPLAVIGIGRDADEAFAPARSDVRGTTVATLAASVADQDPTADPTGDWAATSDRSGIADALDPGRLLEAVGRARRSADVVVVYLHWGVQGQRCPSRDQRSLAAHLVDAGADIVVGSHAHQLQGDGRLGDAYVAYGLGNYAWYSPGDADTSRTGVLYLTVRPRTHGSRPPYVVRAAWAPQRIGADGLPATTTPEDAADFRASRESLRACSGLAP